MGCGVSQKFEHKGQPNTDLQNKHLPDNQSNQKNPKSQNAQVSKPISISKDDSSMSTPCLNQHPAESKPPIVPTLKTPSDEQNQNHKNLNLNNSLTEKAILENQKYPDNPSSSKPQNPLKAKTLHLGFENHPHEFDFSFLEENHTVKVIDLDTEKILKELLEN